MFSKHRKAFFAGMFEEATSGKLRFYTRSIRVKDYRSKPRSAWAGPHEETNAPPPRLGSPV